MYNLSDPRYHDLSVFMPGSASSEERAESFGTDVNVDPSVIVAELPISCQETVDTKAFTGRGRLRELRQLGHRVDTVEQKMMALAQASKRVSSYQMYLVLHRRHATGYVFLRWRATGWSSKHLSWQQAEAIAARYDRERCQWYARASEAAVSLNQRHKELRQQLRELEQLVMNAKQPVFARSIPVKK